MYRLFSCISIDFKIIANFVLVRHLTEPAPYMGQVLSPMGDTFCQWWYSSCYHRMPSRVSLTDRKNIYSRHQFWRKWQPDMIPHSIFLLSMQNGIFDGTLAVGAIGGEPYCYFSNPVAKAFFKSTLILRAFRSYPLGDRTCPTRRKSQYFVFLLETCAIQAQ